MDEIEVLDFAPEPLGRGAVMINPSWEMAWTVSIEWRFPVMAAGGGGLDKKRKMREKKYPNRVWNTEVQKKKRRKKEMRGAVVCTP